MSIYRSFDRYPRSDVHAQEGVEERLASWPRSAASQINIDDRYQHLRKARPVNRPFPHTLMWVASLPHDVRPIALLRRYPRIANLIATTWADRKCFRAYMESLLTDTRGNRRGFPPDVLSNLAALQRYHDTVEERTP
jgi:hypothetical protein